MRGAAGAWRVIDKVAGDLAARDLGVTADEVRAALAATTAEARRQIMDVA